MLTSKDWDKAKYDLEELMDKHSISSVLEMLSEICYEKADHVLSTWADKVLAKAWEKMGSRLDGIKVPNELDVGYEHSHID